MYDFIDVTENSKTSTLPTEAVSINGVWLEDEISGYTTLSVSGREKVEIEINDTSVTGRDGSVYKNRKIKPRTLTIKYQLLAKTSEEFRTAYNKLMAILNTESAKLIFNDEPEYYFDGYFSGTETSEEGSNYVTGTISFYLTDPFKYSNSNNLVPILSNYYDKYPYIYINGEKVELPTASYRETIDGVLYYFNWAKKITNRGNGRWYPTFQARFRCENPDYTLSSEVQQEFWLVMLKIMDDKVREGKIPEGTPQKAIDAGYCTCTFQEIDGNKLTWDYEALLNIGKQTTGGEAEIIVNTEGNNFGVANGWQKNSATVPVSLTQEGAFFFKENYGATQAGSYGSTTKGWHGPFRSYNIAEPFKNGMFSFHHMIKAATSEECGGFIATIAGEVNGTLTTLASLYIFKYSAKSLGACRFYIGNTMQSGSTISNLDFTINNSLTGEEAGQDYIKKEGATITFKVGDNTYQYESEYEDAKISQVSWGFLQYGTTTTFTRNYIFNAQVVKLTEKVDKIIMIPETATVTINTENETVEVDGRQLNVSNLLPKPFYLDPGESVYFYNTMSSCVINPMTELGVAWWEVSVLEEEKML